MVPPRIHSMTIAQTNRVRERVLTLAQQWMLEQNAFTGRFGGAAAFADLDRDRYVGIVNFTYSTADGQTVSGELSWWLD